jgi:hypothetical protein
LSNSGKAEPVYLVIRSDDAGMTHSVNTALERLIATGLPVSVSVMFPNARPAVDASTDRKRLYVSYTEECSCS